VGSVFSPYYARARRRGGGDPADHVALNVALYGEGGRRWAMTERGAAAAARGAHAYAIGPSRLEWRGDALEFAIDEVAVPLPRRIRGTVRVLPRALVSHVARLDAEGRHRWRPIAPSARVEVALDAPGLSWAGEGYLDSNEGDAPLETHLRRWHWSRAALPGGSAVLYDVEARDGARTALALRFDRQGEVAPFEPPLAATLPPTRIWRIARASRADDGAPVVERTLEDTPFYARSVVAQSLLGTRVRAVHESLDLDRFAHPLVQAMLPFRMPRRAR
jgi:carotenoid 1,2-hydratase